MGTMTKPTKYLAKYQPQQQPQNKPLKETSMSKRLPNNPLSENSKINIEDINLIPNIKEHFKRYNH